MVKAFSNFLAFFRGSPSPKNNITPPPEPTCGTKAGAIPCLLPEF
jgi:hypothetical protein